MSINQISSGVLTGKILILISMISCAFYPLILLFISWRQATISVPLGGFGIFQMDTYPYFILYILSAIGFAVGITAFLTKDARKAGKLAVFGGILAGNILNWICLPLMVIGGVLCYLGAGSQKP